MDNRWIRVQMKNPLEKAQGNGSYKCQLHQRTIIGSEKGLTSCYISCVCFQGKDEALWLQDLSLLLNTEASSSK